MYLVYYHQTLKYCSSRSQTPCILQSLKKTHLSCIKAKSFFKSKWHCFVLFRVSNWNLDRVASVNLDLQRLHASHIIFNSGDKSFFLRLQIDTQLKRPSNLHLAACYTWKRWRAKKKSISYLWVHLEGFSCKLFKSHCSSPGSLASRYSNERETWLQTSLHVRSDYGLSEILKGKNV